MDEKKLDLVEFVLEDDKDGVFAISIVSEPAIESNFILFNLEKEKIEFSTNVEKQIITGPALIPNKKILRKYKDGEYYNAIISEQTISDTAQKFFKNQYQNNTTLEHDEKVGDTTYFESWIVEDPANDKANALGFKDIVKGTWFVSCKINSPELWNDVKTGDFHGFSIEAFFTDKKVNFSKEEEKKENNNMVKKILNEMGNLISKFSNVEAQAETQVEVKLTDLKLADGTSISIDDNTLDVYKLDDTGAKIPVEDGDYTLEGGEILSVKDGKKVEVVAQATEDTTSASTSGDVVKQDMVDFTLADGTLIYIDDSNAVHKKEDDSILADGDYSLLDGTALKVVGGIWTETNESVSEQDMAKLATEFSTVKENFESLLVKYEKELSEKNALTEKVVALEREVLELGKKPGAEKTATHAGNGVEFEKMSVAQKIVFNMNKNKNLIK